VLDGGNEFKTDWRHQRWIRFQSADVEDNLVETHCHEGTGSEQGHPTRKALRRTGQVNLAGPAALVLLNMIVRRGWNVNLSDGVPDPEER
jgi:hypothetical protein